MQRLFIKTATLLALLNLALAKSRATNELPRRMLITGSDSETNPETASEWKLLWHDEFDELDANNWEVQKYDGCQYGICQWGNSEKQWYTDRPENVQVVDGKLIIRAQSDQSEAEGQWLYEDCIDECVDRCENQRFTPSNKTDSEFDWCIGDCSKQRCTKVQNRGITSGRIRSHGHFSIAPTEEYPIVRIEANIKLPQGEGLWPAFWMLPEAGAKANCSGCGDYGGWGSSGEIDIIEATNNMSTIFSTIHYGAEYPGNTASGGNITRTLDGSNTEFDFQTFSLEWEADEMRWYLDGHLYAKEKSNTKSPDGWWSAAAPGTNAPFDKPFHLLFNLAVSGHYTGSVDLPAVKETLAEPKEMQVDWVRVFGMPKDAVSAAV